MSLDNLIAPRSSRNKLKKYDSNMQSYLDTKVYNESIRKEEAECEASYKNEKISSVIQESYETRLKKGRHERMRKDQAIEEAVSMTIPVLFASLAYRALPLDEDFKEANVKYIYENATTLFKTLVSAGAIKFEKNNPTAFTEMCEAIAVAYNNCDPDEVSVPEVIKKSLYSNVDNTNAIIKNVTDKVVQAVADEKEVVALKERLMKEDKYVPNDKSLFRYLNEANISYVMKEKPTASKEDIMDLSLSETILDYTLLEMLHTCKLMNFDLTSINTVKKFISK